MDTQDLLNSNIGDKEQPKGTVEPKTVVIVGVSIKEKTSEGVLMKTPMVQFSVMHPDKEEPITLSKMKYIDGDKAITKGFWVQLDENGKFFKGSTVDLLLKKLGCNTLKETEGKSIDTVTESDKSSYLCFKLY